MGTTVKNLLQDTSSDKIIDLDFLYYKSAIIFNTRYTLDY